MAVDTEQGNKSVSILSQQDTEGVFTEYEDEYETYITTIPRDGSLSKETFIKKHESVAKGFQEQLLKVANKELNLNILVSFINEIKGDTRYEERNSETEDKIFQQINESTENNIAADFILYSRTSSDISHTIEKGGEEQHTCRIKEDDFYNLLIIETDIEWLSIPFLAVESNNIEIVKLCIKTGMDLETFRNRKGQTLLGHAVEQSIIRYDVIKMLLNCIGVNIAGNNGETPAISCLKNNKISVKERLALLEIFIDAGASVMTSSSYLGTTLHHFVLSLASEMDVTKLSEWNRVIDVLVTNGVDINAIDFLGQSALICAITIVPPTGLENNDAYDLEARRNIMDSRQCKIKIVEYLLHKGANLEVVSNNGYTALCIALANQNVDVVHTLVKHGANVNHLTNTKMSPAYVICCEADWSEEGDIESILLPSLRILLNAGLDINLKGIDDSTVLHFAAANMNHNICEFLINSGAFIEAIDYLQRTPLHMAVRNANMMVIETLIKRGANIEAKDIHGDTSLTHACLHENTKAVEILVANGANCMTSGDLGIQPIHIAAENGDSLMLEILQNSGCDLSTPDASGSTPLHYAASDGNPDTVQYLLSQNVAKKIKDYQGLIPLHLALLRGQHMVSTVLADSADAVKFGRLPPGIFPNRPLRKMHELEDYLNEIAEPLKTIGKPGAGIGKAILETPGLGRLNLEEGENKEIYKSIQQLCLEIVDRIGELDPLFQCQLINAGSTFEGVKVGYPNEFDFVCHMEKINAFVEKVENVDIPAYCQIIMKDSLPPDISRFCIHSKKSLNSGAVFLHFSRLTRMATYDVLKQKHQNIYSGMVLLRDCSVVVHDSPIPLRKLQGVYVSWRGPTYKHLDVSIDINPVLYTTEWPENAIHSSILLPSIQEKGIYLIPTLCNEHYFTGVMETVAPRTDLWRYSTHHVETLMMQRLPQVARDSYMLCKAFRMEPLTCSIQVTNTDTETGLKKYCPIDDQGNNIQFENDCNYGDIEYKYDDDDEYENDIHVNKLMNEAATDVETVFGLEDAGFGDKVSYFDLINPANSDGTISDSDSFTHKYTGTLGVSTRYQHDEDMYEITAEDCIPSYHLKSIFLQEAEAVLSKSGKFSDDQLKTIPYKVYESLKTSVETKHLTTLFFPDQNIYLQPQHLENLPASIKMRMSYINVIIRLMKELGFTSE